MASSAKITRGHSCVFCYQRKVKCDGHKPCATCVKSRVQCVAKPPSGPRRKPRMAVPREELMRRLKESEDLLRRHGLVPGESEGVQAMGRLEGGEKGTGMEMGRGAGRGPGKEMFARYLDKGQRGLGTPDESRSPEVMEGVEGGKLIVEGGHSRFIENDLWSELGDEIQDSKSNSQRSTDEDDTLPFATSTLYSGGDNLLFGRPVMDNLRSSHPTSIQMFNLWQKYVENVNPLIKLHHVPTFQRTFVDAATFPGDIPTSTEAILFAIYLSSINSLRNDECEKIMGETRAASLTRFSNATQQALINAGFLKTSDLTILQALILFLLAMRPYYDPHTLWILSGLAVRIGQRIGLHSEKEFSNISIFEAEMRRRLWWQILILDFRSSQLAGTSIGGEHQFSGKRPLNINDSDLSPDMRELPREHEGVTDMIFCSIRYEIGDYMRRRAIFKEQGSKGLESIANEDKAIDELEGKLEQKYVRYCDHSIPLHLLSSAMARSAICQMRLLAHHPRRYPDKGARMSQDELDMLFNMSLRMIEYDNLGQTTKSLQGFLWHINVFIQLDAFIYLLGELRNRVDGPATELAWLQVQQTYDNHPEMLRPLKGTLYFAIGNLAVKAWRKRMWALYLSQRLSEPETPLYMAVLQSQRKGANMPPLDAVKQEIEPVKMREENIGDMSDDWAGFLPEDLALDASPMDWAWWQDMMDRNQFGGEGVDFNGGVTPALE